MSLWKCLAHNIYEKFHFNSNITYFLWFPSSCFHDLHERSNFHLLTVTGRLCTVFICLQDKKDLPMYKNSWLKDQDAVMSSDHVAVSVEKVDKACCKAWTATDATIFSLHNVKETQLSYCGYPFQHHLIFRSCYLGQINELFGGARGIISWSWLHLLILDAFRLQDTHLASLLIEIYPFTMCVLIKERWIKISPLGVSWGLIKPSTRCCVWLRATPSINPGWRTRRSRAGLAESNWVCWWM